MNWIPSSSEECSKLWRAGWVPHPKQSVTEWAEDQLTFSARFTSSPGPFRVRSYPYAREWIDAFHPMSGVRSMTLVTGAQVAKTTAIQVGMAYRVARAPAPALWVLDTATNAQSFSESRWQVMIGDCDILKDEKPENLDKFKNLDQAFKKMHLWFVGSNSPGNLAGRSVSLLVMDEVDKFKQSTSKEADATQLAIQRTASFPMSLVVQTSTPTKDTGNIWNSWLKGDQRRYWLPCPHCQKDILFKWPMMKWADEAKGKDGKWDLKVVRESAFMECPECAGQIFDHHKTKMLRAGKWISENPGALPGHRSYHLSALYSVRRSFGALSVKFLQDKESLLGLQDFVNSILAEPWEEQVSDESRPLSVGEYRLGDPLAEGEVGIMGVDVQKDRFYFTARAFKRDGSSRLMDAGQLTTWGELTHKIEELGLDKLKRVGGGLAKLVVIDSGYRTDEVLDYCVREKCIPGKGEDRPQGYAVKVDQVLRKSISVIKPYRRGWILLLFSSGMSQDVLEWLRGENGPAWTIAADASDDYRGQLDSHRKISKRSPITGRESFLWKRIGRRDDHLLDCECMVLALAELGGALKVSGKVREIDNEGEE